MNNTWEHIYRSGKQLNRYPFDHVVSIIAKLFFPVPFDRRRDLKVLDVGCGAGNHTFFLAENGFDATGIDGSTTAIDHCLRQKKDRDSPARFILSDFSKIDFDNNTFDCLLDRESIYANTEEQIRATLTEAHRILKPGGKIVSFMFNGQHYHKLYGKRHSHNCYTEFEQGSFKDSLLASCVDLKELLSLFSEFSIRSIIRHQSHEIWNIEENDHVSDEYIVIAEKIGSDGNIMRARGV